TVDAIDSNTKTVATAIKGTTAVLTKIEGKLDKLVNLLGGVSDETVMTSLQNETILESNKLNNTLLTNLSNKFDKFIKDQYERAAGVGKNAKDGADALKTVAGSLGDL